MSSFSARLLTQPVQALIRAGQAQERRDLQAQRLRSQGVDPITVENGGKYPREATTNGQSQKIKH